MASISTSQALVLVMTTAVILMMTSQSEAWSQWDFNGSDRWNRRRCSKTDEVCSRAERCCHPQDICLRSPQRPGRGFCTRMDNLRTSPGLPAMVPCTVSAECDDGCCREYRRHRVGLMKICGTPSDEFTTFTCA